MRRMWYLFLTAVFLQLFAGTAVTDSRDAGRLAMGIKLFRATLAADLAITDKASPSGNLDLLVFSGEDPEQARQLAHKLGAGGPLRNMPVRVSVSDGLDLSQYDDQPPAGIFIAHATLSDSVLEMLVEFGWRHHVIVYSPFEGQVEQGVTAGLFITAKVQPYVNMRSLEESGIRMKAFFLRVAKQYR